MFQRTTHPMNTHFATGSTNRANTKLKRIQSTLAGFEGYTFYPQGKQILEIKSHHDLASKMKMEKISHYNYEKEFLFNKIKAANSRSYNKDAVSMSAGNCCKRPADPVSKYYLSQLTPVPTSCYMQPILKCTCKKPERRFIHSPQTRGLVDPIFIVIEEPEFAKQKKLLEQRSNILRPSIDQTGNVNDLTCKFVTPSKPNEDSKRKTADPTIRKHYKNTVYQNKFSFFEAVRPPCKSHFVIHPGLISETLKKRKITKHDVSHLRY